MLHHQSLPEVQITPILSPVTYNATIFFYILMSFKNTD